MDQLKLKYIINLVSDLGTKARADQDALTRAQEAIQKSFRKTRDELSGVSDAWQRFTQAGSSSAERQSRYLARLSSSYQTLRSAAESAASAMVKAGRVGANAVAGVAAGGYAATHMLSKPVDYDDRLRGVTATVFQGRDLQGLRNGLKEINDFVVDTVQKTPGASREKTLEAFEKLVAGGAFTYNESKGLLPGVMKTAQAGRADPNDLVAAAEKFKVNLKLNPEEIQLALAKLFRAGKEGGFEIRDSAKWVGPLLPYLKGYKGMDAVERLVTMLQQVRGTAGSNDEAANNLRNFLQKMGSDSTRKDFKKQGFDLDDWMARAAVKGQSPVEAYMDLLDKVIAKADPDGKARRAMKFVEAGATPEEKAERYQSVKKIYGDSAVSKIINDLQEFGGYEGLKRTAEYGRKTLDAVRSETGATVETDFQFRAEGTAAKAATLAASKDIAATEAFNKLAPAINSALDGINGVSKEFPVLTTAAFGAAGALATLAAAAGASSLLQLLQLRTTPSASPPPVVVPPAKPHNPWGSLNGGVAVPEAPVATAAPAAAATSGWKSAASKVGSVAGKGLGAVGMISELFFTSDADMEVLRNADRQRDLMRQGSRGKGYQDDRLTRMTQAPSASGAASSVPVSRVEIGKGEILIRVEAQQGTRASATVVQNMPQTKLDAGATNPAGYKP